MSKKGAKTVSILDTTLRDGEQGEGISFTLEDKLEITKLLDNLGVHYIEGGWPGSNPKAITYFEAVKKLNLKNSKITAFGSTRRANNSAEDDSNLNALIAAKADSCVIFGKTWDFHVTEALKISLETNLDMIEDSVRFLKEHNLEVIYDAEHFFDGYKANKDYALATLKAASDGGADILCLCDTNGGTLPSEVSEIVHTIQESFPTPIGIHTHDDCGLGVANAIAAVESGASHIQGTLNGYGERCGNACLSSIIPILNLKLGINSLSTENLKKLQKAAHTLDEIANFSPKKEQPFVGKSAFAHKGGIHVSAVLKNPETYEHIDPKLVGNKQRVLVSELSGASNLIYKAKEYGIEIDSKSVELKYLVEILKTMEHDGYQFEGAEASFILLMKQNLSNTPRKLKLESFNVINERKSEEETIVSAEFKVSINDQTEEGTGTGVGPVAALDEGLRKVVEPIFPVIKTVKLTDYKVRVLDSKDGTEAKVRVLITSSDGKNTWQTVGVSSNILEASWRALADSFEYKLMKGA